MLRGTNTIGPDPAGASFPESLRKGDALRISDVAAYLNVSHQRASQMYAEGKLPAPEQIDGIGLLWKPAKIERWAEREWWDTRDWSKRR